MQESEKPSSDTGKKKKALSLGPFLTRLIWLCLLPLILLAFYLAVLHIQTLQTQSKNEAKDRVRYAMTIMDSHLNTYIAALQMLASSPFVDRRDQWSELYREAQGFRKDHNAHIIFADTSKKMIFNTRTPFGSQLPDLPLVKGHSAVNAVLETGKPAVGDTFMGPVADEPLIALAVPVIRNDQIRYIMLVTIETSHIQEHINELVLPEGWFITALDGKGEIIARSQSSPINGSRDKDETRQFIAKSAVSHWSLILEIPHTAYIAPVVTSSIALTLAILIATFIGIFGGRIAGRRLSREVKVLSENSPVNTSEVTIEEIAAVGNILNKATLELRESEVIFNRFMEHSPIYVFFKDENIRALRLSKNFEIMLGRPLADLIGKAMDDLFPSEIAKKMIEDDKKILTEGKEITVEEEFNGRFYTTIKFPIHIDGKPRYLAGYTIDITERKKAENELRTSQSRLLEVQHMAHLGNWSWDVKTGAVEWSDEVYRIFRLDPKEFIPRIDSILALSPWPGDHERDKELICRAMESHEKGDYEQRFLRPDKSVGYYYSTFQGHYDETGGLVSIVGAVMDITGHKLADMALFEAETRYHMLFDQAPDGIVIIDPETARILEFNETVCRQLGYSRDEFAQMNISDFNMDFSPEKFKSVIEEVMREKRKDFETRHRTKQDEIRTILVTAQATIISGRYVCHCVWRDITDRRKLQEQLRHAQKLEGLGQLAGGIAHDFNNVLNAVIGFAELIQMHRDKDDPVRHFSDEIITAGMRGASLTRQILAFSRKQELDMKPVNINVIVGNLAPMLRRLVREDIVIRQNLSDENLIVMADSDQIDQVLINLTTNARDAMPGGGSIDISTEPFIMDEGFVKMHGYGSPGKYALVIFSDTGFGMSSETRSYIFDPFFTTKETGKGTGLGLAVVHGILKQHGGHVTVYSEPGKGTIFNIYLPLTDAAVERIDLSQPEERRGGTETILIAEDDASLRKLTRAVLTQFGYNVIEAIDGEDAIQKFSENSDIISLLILDGIMPKKNGREAFEAIRKLRPEMRAIFVSGYADGSFALKDIAEMGAAFLQKPVKPDDLLRVVREMLDAR